MYKYMHTYTRKYSSIAASSLRVLLHQLYSEKARLLTRLHVYVLFIVCACAMCLISYNYVYYLNIYVHVYTCMYLLLVTIRVCEQFFEMGIVLYGVVRVFESTVRGPLLICA